MGDSVFHIVERNGEIELVQLEPVKVKVNSKSKQAKQIENESMRIAKVSEF